MCRGVVVLSHSLAPDQELKSKSTSAGELLEPGAVLAELLTFEAANEVDRACACALYI